MVNSPIGAAARSSKWISSSATNWESRSKAKVSPRDYKGLLALGEEVKLKRKLVVCGEKQRRRADDGVEILPPRDFFRELWADNLLD